MPPNVKLRVCYACTYQQMQSMCESLALSRSSISRDIAKIQPECDLAFQNPRQAFDKIDSVVNCVFFGQNSIFSRCSFK
jgi:hypothetical protein